MTIFYAIHANVGVSLGVKVSDCDSDYTSSILVRQPTLLSVNTYLKVIFLYFYRRGGILRAPLLEL